MNQMIVNFYMEYMHIMVHMIHVITVVLLSVMSNVIDSLFKLYCDLHSIVTSIGLGTLINYTICSEED